MTKRSTTLRDKHRAIIRRTGAPCGICLKPIDYSLPYLHPGEFTVDHILAINRGGLDVLSNKQAAHRRCNRDKSDRVEYQPAEPAPAFETRRAW